MGQRFDPYDILGVPRGATKDTIEAAYREKATPRNPDLNLGESRDEFRRVQEAFEWVERRGFQPDSRDFQPDLDEVGGSTLHPVWSAFEDAAYEAPKESADIVCADGVPTERLSS